MLRSKVADAGYTKMLERFARECPKNQFLREFVKNGRVWEWRNIHIDEKTKYEFEDADGKITIVENLSKFCRDNDLNKGAIHKVIKGERSHHKGYTCRKI